MDIKDLMAAQLLRNKSDFAPMTKHWGIAHYSNAMCGEAGEAANKVKKWERGDYAGDKQSFKEDLGKELADVLSYAFILADVAGINSDDLESFIVNKFNEVSLRINSGIRLNIDGKVSMNSDLYDVKPGEVIREPKAGQLVRYGSGSTSLMRLSSPHVGGWHGYQCMGGYTFSTGPFVAFTDEDMKKWVGCATWRLDTARAEVESRRR